MKKKANSKTFEVTFVFQYTETIRVTAINKKEAEVEAGHCIDPNSFGGATVADIRVEEL